MPQGPDLPEASDCSDARSTELLEEPRRCLVEPTRLLADDDGADAPLIEAEEKDLVEAPREARILRLELRIRVEELPPALREALAALDPPTSGSPSSSASRPRTEEGVRPLL